MIFVLTLMVVVDIRVMVVVILKWSWWWSGYWCDNDGGNGDVSGYWNS
jgi:hypothetical protein